MKRAPYYLEAGDRGGILVWHQPATDFGNLLFAAALLQHQHPDAVVYGYSDEADIGWNGLTEDEEEALDAILRTARNKARRDARRAA